MDSSVDSSPLLGNIEGVPPSLFYQERQTNQEEAERIERAKRANMGKTDRAIKLEDREKAYDEREERQKRRETGGPQEVVFGYPRDSLGNKITNPDGSPYLPEIQIGRNNPTHETNLGFSKTTEVRPDGDYWYTNEDKRKAKEQKRKESGDGKWDITKAEGDEVTFCSTLGKCMTITLTAGALAAFATKQAGLWGGKKTKRRKYTKKQSKRHRGRKSRKNKKSSKNNKK